jgi:Fe2+ or Zn2+ uptake regulation protein
MRLNSEPNGSEPSAARTLRDAGLKATPQRLAILRALDGDETHPTAQELFDRLRSDFPTLAVATVYNTLAALTRMRRCVPLELGGPLRFDPNVSAHDHAVCERCAGIRDVMQPPVVAADSGTPRDPAAPVPGFRVRRVERIYRGLCADCAEAAE